jgi:SAM-dependent methyltransferase
MVHSNIFNEQVDAYEAWFEKYPEVYESEVIAIREHFSKLPENIDGIEVGLGTGRFAYPLGIKQGIEPSEEMAKKARKRGLEIMNGVAEQLPYKDMKFDFVLFVTVCHLANVRKAFSEAHRVLKPGGSLLVGFLDKDQGIAMQYEEQRERSHFYKHATFYTVKRILQLLKDTRFINPEINQTLFGNLEEIKSIQSAEPGHGKGSFVVIRAVKK